MRKNKYTDSDQYTKPVGGRGQHVLCVIYGFVLLVDCTALLFG